MSDHVAYMVKSPEGKPQKFCEYFTRLDHVEHSIGITWGKFAIKPTMIYSPTGHDGIVARIGWQTATDTYDVVADVYRVNIWDRPSHL